MFLPPSSSSYILHYLLVSENNPILLPSQAAVENGGTTSGYGIPPPGSTMMGLQAAALGSLFGGTMPFGRCGGGAGGGAVDWTKIFTQFPQFFQTPAALMNGQQQFPPSFPSLEVFQPPASGGTVKTSPRATPISPKQVQQQQQQELQEQQLKMLSNSMPNIAGRFFSADQKGGFLINGRPIFTGLNKMESEAANGNKEVT